MRLRIRYTKLGKVRFVSHRDGARLWERALRRVGIPVASTRGFTPRPKLSFGLALPTGAESIAEYLDVEVLAGHLEESPAALAGRLSEALPDGIDALVVEAHEERLASLQEGVTSTTWELSGEALVPPLVARSAERLLASPHLLLERERKGHRCVDDVRPAIVDLHADPTGNRLVAELATVGRGLRPAELAAVAFPDVDPLDVHVLRTHQWIEHDEERREVLPLPADVSAARAGSGA